MQKPTVFNQGRSELDAELGAGLHTCCMLTVWLQQTQQPVQWNDAVSLSLGECLFLQLFFPLCEPANKIKLDSELLCCPGGERESLLWWPGSELCPWRGYGLHPQNRWEIQLCELQDIFFPEV